MMTNFIQTNLHFVFYCSLPVMYTFVYLFSYILFCFAANNANSEHCFCHWLYQIPQDGTGWIY